MDQEGLLVYLDMGAAASPDPASPNQEVFVKEKNIKLLVTQKEAQGGPVLSSPASQQARYKRVPHDSVYGKL